MGLYGGRDFFGKGLKKEEGRRGLSSSVARSY